MIEHTSHDTAARQARSKATADRNFNAFMEKQETKLVVSMLPPANPPEALSTLLRMAFEAGSNSGASDVLGDIVEAMLKSPRKD